MLNLLTDPQAWIALLALSALEIVLGIDNVVFIAVLASRLDPRAAHRARQIGLLLALVFRIALLFGLTWLIGLRDPVFSVFGQAFSWHDLILISGGLFLIAKATHEIHAEIEGAENDRPAQNGAVRRGLLMIVVQICVVDLVFSIDSIVTAIGMAQDIRIMIAAVLIAVAAMYFSAAVVGAFIAEHPTTKILALTFLVLIGTALVADGFDVHIPRGYIYFAMGYAGVVELVNVLVRKRRKSH